MIHLPGFEHGLNRAIHGIFTGFITSLLLKFLSAIGLFDIDLLTILTIILAIVSALSLILKMKYWSTGYILGFVMGYLMMAPAFGIDGLTYIVLLFALYIMIRRIVRQIY